MNVTRCVNTFYLCVAYMCKSSQLKIMCRVEIIVVKMILTLALDVVGVVDLVFPSVLSLFVPLCGRGFSALLGLDLSILVALRARELAVPVEGLELDLLCLAVHFSLV